MLQIYLLKTDETINIHKKITYKEKIFTSVKLTVLQHIIMTVNLLLLRIINNFTPPPVNYIKYKCGTINT